MMMWHIWLLNNRSYSSSRLIFDWNVKWWHSLSCPQVSLLWITSLELSAPSNCWTTRATAVTSSVWKLTPSGSCRPTYEHHPKVRLFSNIMTRLAWFGLIFSFHCKVIVFLFWGLVNTWVGHRFSGSIIRSMISGHTLRLFIPSMLLLSRLDGFEYWMNSTFNILIIFSFIYCPNKVMKSYDIPKRVFNM